ncbi:STAS domain-containing protein [Pseudooceanicola sp. C21-150M6]|uniref:STAS domain-containing protein n=1 Tax=Pseudooceanicola sp. C21-150M6 TaxID=3434355 RepID=UPI003D7FAA67
MADCVKLPARLDLSAAPPLAQELRDRLGADLALDAAEVIQIGALCTQVIRSAVISLAAEGYRLDILNLSDKCADQLGHLGFTPATLTEART